MLNIKTFLLSDDTEENFYDCLENKLAEYFEKNRNCSLPWDRQNMTVCTQKVRPIFDRFNLILQRYGEYSVTRKWMNKIRDSDDTWKTLSNLGCPAPCVQTYYALWS